VLIELLLLPVDGRGAAARHALVDGVRGPPGADQHRAAAALGVVQRTAHLLRPDVHVDQHGLRPPRHRVVPVRGGPGHRLIEAEDNAQHRHP